MKRLYVSAMTLTRPRILGALGAAVVLAVVLAGRSPESSAGTRVPTDPREVLETVQATGDARSPRTREMAALRSALAQEPHDLGAAVRLARLDIELARERSDPRYLGRAQAALAPWWTDDAPPAVLVLRATIEQSLHDFDAALRHLDLALARAPDDPQAWLTRAVVLTVRARYDEARASCDRAKPLAPPVAWLVCTTQLDSLLGHAGEARIRLESALAQPNAEAPAAVREWAISSLAEYASRSGDAASAERFFRGALALAPDDAYVRAALADLLIDATRFSEAADLVKDFEADDGLLLRLATAERRGKLPRAADHVAMLEARFDASRARGDVVHRREESRFWLDLKDDPRRALASARANWDVQKEPWDVRVLLAAAVASKDGDAASPALEHLERTHLEDPAIARLASAAKELRR
jgi:Tfp pilus assembly protein PilF